MRSTRFFDVKQVRNAKALVTFLTTKGIVSGLYTDYINNCFGETEQVFFVKYEKHAQMYVDAWETFMNVKYLNIIKGEIK